MMMKRELEQARTIRGPRHEQNNLWHKTGSK